ncbi:hypothetical protein OCJ37_16565 [Xanthomonas sp. AM6]|nr:hypothetical protein [Xanthomonas sp. AM6]UYB51566.1 hypothetical protein OCJ37_16565 [Xanthomonas sp. AM6]
MSIGLPFIVTLRERKGLGYHPVTDLQGRRRGAAHAPGCMRGQ